jgi:putative tryptophan/tyrosine transport system substrate-binding protein
MKRREFITLLGGAAVAFPLASRAQQPTLPVIGWLSGGSPVNDPGPEVEAFFKGLNEMGYVEGRNVAIEYRHAENQYDRLPALAADLVRRRVAVIVAIGAANSAMAAKAATATIPIVFVNGVDPIKVGLVPSLSRPSGNVTGMSYFTSTLVAKRLELLREMVPQAATATIGFLTNPTNLLSEGDTADIQAAARSIGQQIDVLRASTVNEIDTAFAAAAERHLGALLVDGDNLFNERRNQMAALAARYKIPSSYPTRVFAEAGGLMSYGENRRELNRQAGIYVGRILKGDKPSDLPVQQPTRFELVVNLKAAKAIGLTISESFLLRADEVIE